MQIRSAQYVLDWSSWLWRLLNTQKVVSSILALSIKFLTFSIIKWLNIFVNGHSKVCRVWPNPFFFAIGCGIWRGGVPRLTFRWHVPLDFSTKNGKTEEPRTRQYIYILTYIRCELCFVFWIEFVWRINNSKWVVFFIALELAKGIIHSTQKVAVWTSITNSGEEQKSRFTAAR